ncbi:hypothetical protein NBO_424g0004 [Nosema bombycis CQ1]|uniref:Uncharacterized protein n=1 Tax=Nosema bombycis (strain CQ1 / CVCC 102059) TaxID=578461 RepID=R0KP74_NOSB1|nr:hypothetical protein NBO_424g0004 [Nosema bombycis CQ1]|eukprot:EOB12496.1 hypothetical protein NBO_424g0004 [Nosema bombycis CQ1]
MKFDKNTKVFRNEDEYTKTFEVSKLNASCLFYDTINFQIPKSEDRSTIKKSHLALFEYIMMASNAAKKFLKDVFNLFSKDENLFKENIKCNIYDAESRQVVDLYFYHLFESINQSIQDCKLENLNKTENVTENKVVFNFINIQNSFIANNTINIENFNFKNLYLNTILPDGTEKVYFFENTDHQLEKLFLDYVEKIILVISKLEVDPNHSIKQKFDKTAQKTLKTLEFRISSNVYTEANSADEVEINGIKNDDQRLNTYEIKKAEDEAKKAISKYIFEVFNLPVDNGIIENTHKDKDKIFKGERFKRGR